MKRKFIILTLCFTLIFSSINYKRVNALDFVISPTILAIVSTLAVGTGIALQGADDIYDIGRLFYEYVDRNNELTWDIIQTTFASALSIGESISINNDILDICKGFFDSVFNLPSDTSISKIGNYAGIPVLTGVDHNNFNKYSHLAMSIYEGTKIGNYDTVRVNSEGLIEFGTSANITLPFSETGGYKIFINAMRDTGSMIYRYYHNGSRWVMYGSSSFKYTYSSINGTYVDVPYNGGYSWDNVEDKKNEGTGDLFLPIPNNVGDLVGKNPSDVWEGNYENGLVGDKPLSIPDVDSPSISVSGDDVFVNSGVSDTPTDTPSWLPSFPSFGNELDFSPLYMTNIKEKFPFSLPWDLKNIIDIFDVAPSAPKFETTFLGQNIILDFSYFEEWAVIIRFFISIIFTATLIFISTRMKG